MLRKDKLTYVIASHYILTLHPQIITVESSFSITLVSVTVSSSKDRFFNGKHR